MRPADAAGLRWWTTAEWCQGSGPLLKDEEAVLVAEGDLRRYIGAVRRECWLGVGAGLGPGRRVGTWGVGSRELWGVAASSE